MSGRFWGMFYKHEINLIIDELSEFCHGQTD